MRRLPDWEARLTRLLREAETRDFNWASWNCCVFTADCMVAMTGVDTMAGWRKPYRSALAATRAIRRFAGGGLVEAGERLSQELGCPSIPVSLAGRGDPVLIDSDGVRFFGVIDMTGSHVRAVVPGHGLIRAPRDFAILAWRVG